MTTTLRAASGSSAENLFISLFEDVFGAEKAGYLFSQYPFFDIYQDSRFADFLLENGGRRVAIEIDDDASHLPGHVSQVKHYDDLTKQNSMIHMGWAVYRWPVRIMQEQPERMKDELRIFLGSQPQFRAIADYLPTQRGRTFQLKEHQQEALDALQKMREAKETIALIHHATGTGKTVTAVSDAKRMGGRTLYIAHTKDLITQAADTFRELWPEASLGLYVENHKETDAQVICASVQSVALNLDSFLPDAFNYLIIDEAHHAAAETYQKVLAYFTPRFTLGLTATPERADDQNILEIFKNTAHRLDIQTAVEIGELVPVRCIRIHTNIDMTKVRFNSVQYNIRDLESKIFVPERNQLIVDTWMEFVRDKRTVIFCASIRHAEQIAALLNERGVPALAVSGSMKLAERNEATQRFALKKLLVLCACDLLNEGWDCPETEVLFMARPTMSKVLYTQQLGRGMRLADGKDSLMVFDFVDNASQYNMPYSLHRLFRLKDYHAGGLVAAPMAQKTAEENLYARGERPDALVDYPVDATDYELVDLFNWQEEAAGMLSQMEFVRRVDIQEDTLEKYIQDGKIQPDLVVPISKCRVFKYFKEEKVKGYANQFGWTLITDSNRKDIFLEMIERMDMNYSYKPVFILAMLENCDKNGRARIEDIVAYFRRFYQQRRENGLIVEKPKSVYCKEQIEDAEIRRNILAYPFRRFELMSLIDSLDSMDREISSLLKKRQNGYLTDDEKIHLQELIDNREAIIIKYKLQPDSETEGFQTIRDKVEAEVARAQARGQLDADVSVYQNAIVAAAQGMATLNSEIDAQYDSEYALIQLMEDGAEKEAALADLNTRYNEQRLAAAREYAQTLAQMVNPVWNDESMQQTGETLSDLAGKLTLYDAAVKTYGENSREAAEALDAVKNAASGLDEGDLTEYAAILTQISELLTSGMSMDEVQALFPEIDVSTALEQLASIQQFTSQYQIVEMRSI